MTLLPQPNSIPPELSDAALQSVPTKNWPSRRRLVVIASLFTIPWLVVLAIAWKYSSNENSTEPLQTVANTAPDVEQAGASEAAQPWGNLQAIPIVISPPLEFVDLPILVYSEGEQQDESMFDWHFENMERAEFGPFLRKAGLSTADQTRLMSTVRDMKQLQGLQATPTEQIVRGMSPATRSVIYHKLSTCIYNREQNTSFAYRGNSVDQWLADADLSPRTIDLVRPLVYRNGRFLFFCDFRLIWPELTDRDERARLLRALSREETYLLKLHLDSKSDIDALVEYWGVGGREGQIRPLFESLADLPEGGTIDITHLLPSFARARLYTYPSFGKFMEDITRDCHWSAMNFFNEYPDDRFSKSSEVVEAIQSDYRRIARENLHLGDLVLYSTKDMHFHSAVYIAGDYLLTKNGSRPSRPWMLMPMTDMADYYPEEGPIDIHFYRAKSR